MPTSRLKARAKDARKAALLDAIEELASLWHTSEAGEVLECGPQDAWKYEAAPPWMHIVVKPDNYEVVPVLPEAWLRKFSIKGEPSAKAKKETLEKWNVSRSLVAAVDVARAELAPVEELERRLARWAGRSAVLHHFDLAIDTETTGLNPYKDELVGISFAVMENNHVIDSWYQPWSQTVSRLAQSLAGNCRRVIGWHSLFDQDFLNAHGCDIRFTDDGKALAWLTNLATIRGLPTGNEEGRAPALKEVATSLLGVHGVPFMKLLKAWGATDIRGVPWKAQSYYGRNDALWTAQLFPKLMGLAGSARDQKVYRLEMDLLPVTSEMGRGWRLDGNLVGELYHKTKAERDSLVERIRDDHGLDLSEDENGKCVSTEADKRAAVYQGIKPTKYTKTKKEPSIDTDALKSLGTPLALDMVELSGLNKSLSAFLEPAYEETLSIGAADVWVYPDWRQYGTWSGRYAVAKPAIQQQPEPWRVIYRADRPEDTLVGADYSQLEIRIAAATSGDPKMIEICNTSEIGFHEEVAKLLSEAMGSTVLKKHAKIGAFAAIYGAVAKTIARNSKIPLEYAELLIRENRRLFPVLWNFIPEWVDICRRNGSTTALTGLTRLLPNINSSNWVLRMGDERIAFNHLVQGTAAGIVKRAMLEMYQWYDGFRSLPIWRRVRLVAQIHDELIYNVPRELAEGFAEKLKEVGEAQDRILRPVRLEFEPHIGDTWYAAKGLEAVAA